MQTFVPFADLSASVAVLDDRRLGKQRVEVFQVLRALTWPTYAWKQHPAVAMWRGFVPALVAYGVACCDEWTRRGYADVLRPQLLEWSGGQVPAHPELPPWWGVEELHRSHRAALVRKDPEHYLPLLGPHDEPLDYLWPPPAFPRWPLPRGAVDLAAAARLLGVAAPYDWQRVALEALADGRDVLAVVAPGAGGRTLGLLAGLTVDGTVLWRAPRPGTPAGPPPRVPRSPGRAAAGGPVAASVARPPSPADRLAMAQEAAATGWVFRTPDTRLDEAALVVDDLTGRGWPRALRRSLAPTGWRTAAPVLAITERADAAARSDLVRRHGLRDPVHVGAGWDPGGWLGALAVTPKGRREAVVALVRAHPPTLVRVSSRAHADQLVTLLAAHGLRAASWDPRLRAGRRDEAVAQWRRRRLDALVVAPGDPDLGRVAPALLLHADAPASAEQWRAACVGVVRAVVLVTAEAAPGLRALTTARCVRASLLDPTGEPVAVPCPGCSACAPPLPPGGDAVSEGGPGAR